MSTSPRCSRERTPPFFAPGPLRPRDWMQSPDVTWPARAMQPLTRAPSGAREAERPVVETTPPLTIITLTAGGTRDSPRHKTVC